MARVSVNELLRRFGADRRGNIGLLFAVAAPALIGASFLAIEMAQINTTQAKLQGLADSAAIAAARELRLGNSTKDTVLAVAQSIVDSGAGSIKKPITFAGDVPDDKKSVSVELSAEVSNSLATTVEG